MSVWYAMNLGDALLADASLDRLTGLFQKAHDEAGRPSDMRMFIRHESEGRLHCELVVYFSPAAAGVARASGAVPCRTPAVDGLSLVAGADALSGDGTRTDRPR